MGTSNLIPCRCSLTVAPPNTSIKGGVEDGSIAMGGFELKINICGDCMVTKNSFLTYNGINDTGLEKASFTAFPNKIYAVCPDPNFGFVNQDLKFAVFGRGRLERDIEGHITSSEASFLLLVYGTSKLDEFYLTATPDEGGTFDTKNIILNGEFLIGNCPK